MGGKKSPARTELWEYSLQQSNYKGKLLRRRTGLEDWKSQGSDAMETRRRTSVRRRGKQKGRTLREVRFHWIWILGGR